MFGGKPVVEVEASTANGLTQVTYELGVSLNAANHVSAAVNVEKHPITRGAFWFDPLGPTACDFGFGVADSVRFGRHVPESGRRLSLLLES